MRHLTLVRPALEKVRKITPKLVSIGYTNVMDHLSSDRHLLQFDGPVPLGDPRCSYPTAC